MRTRVLRRPIVFLRVRCSIPILLIKLFVVAFVRCSIPILLIKLFVVAFVRCSIPHCICVCVCVWERQTERREGEKGVFQQTCGRTEEWGIVSYECKAQCRSVSFTRAHAVRNSDLRMGSQNVTTRTRGVYMYCAVAFTFLRITYSKRRSCPCAHHRSIRGSKGIPPAFLTSALDERMKLSFRHRPAYPCRKCPWYPSGMRLGPNNNCSRYISQIATLEFGWLITSIHVCVYDFKVESKLGADGTEAFRLSQHNHLTSAPFYRRPSTKKEVSKTLSDVIGSCDTAAAWTYLLSVP
jgi:hypothetical protein